MQDFGISDSLIARIAGLAGQNGRAIVAVAGPPGSGKSTLAEALVDRLCDRGQSAALVPMDGFHFDDSILIARGLRPVKGAPETFDIAGFASLLRRLRANDAAEVAIPAFDRRLELSRNAARIVPQSARFLVVEGNYLLLDRPGWRELAPLFDLTLALSVPPEELRRRLFRRWADHGIAPDEAARRVEGNDLPNGLTVLRQSRPADVTLLQGAQTDTFHFHPEET